MVNILKNSPWGLMRPFIMYTQISVVESRNFLSSKWSWINPLDPNFQIASISTIGTLKKRYQLHQQFRKIPIRSLLQKISSHESADSKHSIKSWSLHNVYYFIVEYRLHYRLDTFNSLNHIIDDEIKNFDDQ